MHTLNANAKKNVHFQTFCKKKKNYFFANIYHSPCDSYWNSKNSIKLKPPNVRGHTNSVLWMYAVCWLRQVTLIQFSQRIFWTNCVHSWYGVGVTAYIHGTELMWPHKVMVRSWCVHCSGGQRYSKMYRLKRYRHQIFEKKIE